MDCGFRVYSLMETLLSAHTIVFRLPSSCLNCSAPRSTRSAEHAHPAPTVTYASVGIWREIPSLFLSATTCVGERKQHPERKRFHVNRRRSPPSLRPILRSAEPPAAWRCRAAGGLVASLRYDDHEPVRWLGAGGTSAGP